VESDGDWPTYAVTTGEVMGTYKARELMHRIAEATHVCGDPGVQYDTTINAWNPCLNSGRINASNPCSEFMFLDNSACNLASLNLMKFLDPSGALEVARLRHAVRLFIIAQEILVDNASYPSEEITANSHRFRPLGLGYANLGALLMSLGLPYDSDRSRAFAGVVTALLTGTAYETSAEIAAVEGPFSEFPRNRECMLAVVRKHADALEHLDRDLCPPDLFAAAEAAWQRACQKGEAHGFRNAQVTLLAPTGTIGFLMDCDTTGVEPDIALVKYKQLAGGGVMKLVNRTAAAGLRRLGYSEADTAAILGYLDEQETIEGAPLLKEEHLPVFDCAFKPKNGTRCISSQAHLKMMAAVQPFLSGAISKTINMPNETTVEEIQQAYLDGWRLGLKAVAIYRNGSKRTQPLNTGRTDSGRKPETPEEGRSPDRPLRARMPATRRSITHKFEVAGHEGYLTVGLYDDGKPGELFITMAKEGSTAGGIMDAFGTAISLCLQYGVPLRELVRKFSHSRFEPAGYTRNPDIPQATSLVDYIFHWLDLTFPDGRAAPGLALPAHPAPSVAAPAPGDRYRVDQNLAEFQEDAPLCDVCGALTVRNASCYRCLKCGNSMGCS
jgi:ribonucleoside-diphosphate reductase alpha chain